jgi:DNA helicase-2/ATP-dependent DNA helicase PcrA
MEWRLPDHPDAAPEAARLTCTLSVIHDEIGKLETETGVGADEDRIIKVPEGIDADEMVTLNILRMKLQTLHQLALARRQPFFSRLDFIPKGGTPETHYLGRWGVLKTPEYSVEVVDWRSPVANLYYSGQVGPMAYEAPDGRVEGELTLKRMITVTEGRLTGIFDSGVVSQDAYLQGVLGSVSTDRLREIVTTIQAEQNIVIRHGIGRPLIVQGVAGSGKTTIALHRIAWLLYAYQETLAPASMMIVAPNPLFLDYISAVLPDLGVQQVQQTTFLNLCRRCLGKQMVKVRWENRLEDQLRMTAAERAALGAVLRIKGSLRYKRVLEDFLDIYERQVIPAGDVRFGNEVLYTEAELKAIYLTQLKPFPLRQRVSELQKYMQGRLKKSIEHMTDQLEAMVRERLDALVTRLPDNEERRARTKKLLENREKRLAELKEEQKKFLKAYPGVWPAMNVLEVYGSFLEYLERDNIFGQAGGDLLLRTRESIGRGEAGAEDLPAVTVIGRRVWGIPRLNVSHVVMDEAQDFSPFHCQLLKEMAGHDSFTMVGDLMQGIHGDEGIRDWDEVAVEVFRGQAARKQLIISYRNTVEIMSAASRIAARHPVPGQPSAKPVLRHGEKPSIIACKNDRERLKAIAEIAEAWVKEGYHSIALIEKNEEDCRALHRTLPQELNARLLRAGDSHFEGGVLVIPAALVKGLEFDCVLVTNVSADVYPDEPFFCRLLYVLCTRPLHRLALAYVGEKSQLLAEIGQDEAIFCTHAWGNAGKPPQNVV